MKKPSCLVGLFHAIKCRLNEFLKSSQVISNAMMDDVETDNTPEISSSKKHTFDFIIIGQGLSGTFLSYYLLKANKKILVIDEDRPHTATKIASGVINPVTGRRIVRTWRIEELLPFALDAYTAIGKDIDSSLITSTSIIDFHATPQMKQAFEKRIHEGEEYLQIPTDELQWQRYFNYLFGAGIVTPCLLIDLQTFLQKWKQKLMEADALWEERFDWTKCKVSRDCVEYKNITAEKIICCDGVAGFDNTYFSKLPYAKIKGEAIIAGIADLPSNYIYKQGLSIVPWKDELFWVGSSYEWSYRDVKPTSLFKQKIEAQLRQWLKVPFEIVDHFASERPATIERRPFVGLHPHYPAIGILNGMGTKGCSLAPFFAHQLTKYLLQQKPLYPEVDVQRFNRILASS